MEKKINIKKKMLHKLANKKRSFFGEINFWQKKVGFFSIFTQTDLNETERKLKLYRNVSETNDTLVHRTVTRRS